MLVQNGVKFVKHRDWVVSGSSGWFEESDSKNNSTLTMHRWNIYRVINAGSEVSVRNKFRELGEIIPWQ